MFFLFTLESAKVLILAFLAITFLQSSYDKVVDWTGNLNFLQNHFSTTLLAKVTPMLLAILTVTESLTGVTCLFGAVFIILGIESHLPLFGAQLSCLSLLMLLLGQRIAKDYEGAANLTGYFIISVCGVVLNFLA